MEVDMSPEAVTVRLRTMNELWLLSVKLMNSKKIATACEPIYSLAIDGETQADAGSKKTAAEDIIGL